jgi:tRNA(Ile)-lysidine synthase TilS/MesJ
MTPVRPLQQAESLLMSCFHNGQLRTMKCHYRAKEHEVRIIRPLNYVRETLTRQYAILKGLPVIDENCPGCFEQPKERARIKVLLASQEQVFPDLYGRLLRAMMPLMAAECVDQVTSDPPPPLKMVIRLCIYLLWVSSGRSIMVHGHTGGCEDAH